MDTFELNKIVGAVLSALLFIFGMRAIDLTLARPPLVHPGYQLPSSTQSPGATTTSVSESLPPIAELLKLGNAADGKDVFKICQACHSGEKNGGAKVGPNLWGIVGRNVASYPGFDYSPAMRNKGGQWTLDSLAHYLRDPRAAVPGTKMTFGGVLDNADLASLLHYLRSLSDNAAPLQH